MRIALYARVSPQRQAQAQTVEQQMERLTSHARQQNWTVPLEQVFRDIEQDHRRIKRLVRPGLGFGGLQTARHTLAGYGTMAMVRKGQVHNVGGRDMQAQAAFVAGLFEMGA